MPSPLTPRGATWQVRVLAQASGVFAAVFFALLLAISLWWTITYKGQTELFLLMPLEEPPAILLGLMPFQIFVVVMFVGKAVHMLDILHVQTKHDLFFLDWEQVTSPDLA